MLLEYPALGKPWSNKLEFLLKIVVLGGGGEEAYAYRTRNADRARSHRTCPCRMAWRHNLQSQATLAHPPPGWTKTPLFLELSALKEHVATPCRQVGPIGGPAVQCGPSGLVGSGTWR